MSLSKAILPSGAPFDGASETPVPCERLRPLMGVPFTLPCEDPWLQTEGTRGHTYLEAAREAWLELPEWMDFLATDSPAWDIKRAARDIYLSWLVPALPAGGIVLDVGCGIGRLTQSMLDRGFTVVGVDGDLQSLQRCAWHAAGRDGALDLHWSTPFALPDVQADVVIAVEVLCYFEDPAAALKAIVERLKPGGLLFLSMEGRWGWAGAADAPADGLSVALGDGDLLDLPGDRYVHLFDRDRMTALLEGAGLQVETLVPTHYLTDGPLEELLPTPMSLEKLLELEKTCREHPVWSPLNRIWTATARKPAAP